MDILKFTKLFKIFNEKKWTDNEDSDIVFNNFCHLLTNLDEKQQDLIVELVERYTWITFSQYHSKLIRVMDLVEQEKIDALKNIILFPIMKPEDEGKTKSGHVILYMIRAVKPTLKKYKNINFKEIESYNIIKAENFQPKQNESIFLIDDYLGSGETIKATIEEILKNRKIEPSQINVISIAAQSDSIDFLKKNGINYYADMITSKGISDFYKSPQLEEKIKTMEEIEKMIPGNHFSFGYNQSEALMTLMRTPDNTFPIFWKSYKKDKKDFDAPFSRY